MIQFLKTNQKKIIIASILIVLIIPITIFIIFFVNGLKENNSA